MTRTIQKNVNFFILYFLFQPNQTCLQGANTAGFSIDYEQIDIPKPNCSPNSKITGKIPGKKIFLLMPSGVFLR